MEAPKCKICSQRHYGLCPPAKGGDAHAHNKPVTGIPSASDVAKPRIAKKRAARGTFDRTAYQREFMRRLRAALKSAPTE